MILCVTISAGSQLLSDRSCCEFGGRFITASIVIRKVGRGYISRLRPVATAARVLGEGSYRSNRDFIVSYTVIVGDGYALYWILYF